MRVITEAGHVLKDVLDGMAHSFDPFWFGFQINRRTPDTQKVGCAFEDFQFSTFDVDLHESDVVGVDAKCSQIVIEGDHLDFDDTWGSLGCRIDVRAAGEQLVVV